MRGRSSLNAVRAGVFAATLAGAWLGNPASAYPATKTSAPVVKKPFAYDTDGIVSIGADPGSVSGPAVLQFQGVTGASFNPTSAQPINLGQFVAVPSSVASGQATTYSGTPFEVEVKTPEFDKTSHVPILDQVFPSLNKTLHLKSTVENSLLLKGHLDGTVGANGQVNVVATVDSIKLGSINTGSSDQTVQYAFPIRYSQFKLPTGWTVANSPVSVTVPTSTSNSTMSAMGVAPTSTTATGTTTSLAPAPAAESFVVSSPTTTSTSPANAPLPTPAPEPSTILLFATVVGGLILGRKRIRPR